MIIGIDDTDSRKGGCTTYLAAVLAEELREYGEVHIPMLIRLNPMIKYKTRGNGAVSIKIETDRTEEVEEIVIQKIWDIAELKEENTNPGVVFVENVTKELTSFSEMAIKTILRIDDALRLISKFGIYHKKFKNGRGLIGALAATGAVLNDYTYELIAYRYENRRHLPRYIDERSVWAADEVTYPLTWDTVDLWNEKIVFSPHSHCPVLYGIRGDDLSAIYRADKMIRSEPIERKVLFKTNQGTDSHLISSSISEVQNGMSYIINGRIKRSPFTIKGGHTIFTISDGMKELDCAAYEPTKNFRGVIRMLREDDDVSVYGSLKNDTLNVEKIEIKSLNHLYENPRCPICKKRMKSAGRNGGYRCKRCKTDTKDRVIRERSIETGLYEVPPVARRHISKPLIRERGKRVYPSR